MLCRSAAPSPSPVSRKGVWLSLLAVTAAVSIVSASSAPAILYGFGYDVHIIHFVLSAGIPLVLTPAIVGPLLQANERLRMMQAELERLLRTDLLTGLPNRLAFFEQADRLFASDSVGTRCAVMMIDIDRFKQINDTYGHEAGDAYLRAIGPALLRVMAQSGAQGFLGRIGGEEFAAVACGIDEAAACALAQDFVGAARSLLCRHRDARFGTTLSIGIALRSGHESLDAVLHRADEAVYRAKRNGRDQWQLAPTPARRLHVAAPLGMLAPRVA